MRYTTVPAALLAIFLLTACTMAGDGGASATQQPAVSSQRMRSGTGISLAGMQATRLEMQDDYAGAVAVHDRIKTSRERDLLAEYIAYMIGALEDIDALIAGAETEITSGIRGDYTALRDEWIRRSTMVYQTLLLRS